LSFTSSETIESFIPIVAALKQGRRRPGRSWGFAEGWGRWRAAPAVGAPGQSEHFGYGYGWLAGLLAGWGVLQSNLSHQNSTWVTGKGLLAGEFLKGEEEAWGGQRSWPSQTQVVHLIAGQGWWRGLGCVREHCWDFGTGLSSAFLGMLVNPAGGIRPKEKSKVDTPVRVCALSFQHPHWPRCHLSPHPN